MGVAIVSSEEAALNRLRVQRAQVARWDLEPDLLAERLDEFDREIAQLETDLGLSAPEMDPVDTLRAGRPALALRAVEGDPGARDELDALEASIADAERTIELHALASVEQERVSREEAAAKEREDQARLTAELDEVLALRQAALETFWARLSAATAEAPTFLELDDRAHNLGVRLGRPVSSMRAVAAELVLVAAHDAGLGSRSWVDFPVVRAASRARLLRDFPTQTSDAAAETPSVPQCSICSRDDRATIDGELVARKPLREVAESFGVSRSALSRHRAHSEAVAAA